MFKQVMEKLTKNKKTGITNQRNIARKDPKIINLSKHQLTKFQMLLLTNGTKFSPVKKGGNANLTKQERKALNLNRLGEKRPSLVYLVL